MRVLRLIWSGVLAFDRIGTRIPQLVQIWLVELFVVMPLAFFAGKVVDIRGCCGVEGTHESMPGVFWGALVVGLVAGYVFVLRLVRPKVVEGTWTPTHQVDIGDYALVVPNRRATVSYEYLSSHPSYALLLLITLPLPAVMVLATHNQGDSTFYFRAAGVAGLVIIGLMALARVVAWYVVRAGRRGVADSAADQGVSSSRLAWEIAWKPVVMLMVLIYGLGGVPTAVMFAQEHRAIAALPVVDPATAEVGDFYRVVGQVQGEPVFWIRDGGGRGGNNYSGAGVLVGLDDGGEVLLLAESLAVPDLKGVLDDVDDGHLRAQGRVIDTITDDQRTYSRLTPEDFPPAGPGGRVMVLLERP